MIFRSKERAPAVGDEVPRMAISRIDAEGVHLTLSRAQMLALA